jgi:hypothetical protein
MLQRYMNGGQGGSIFDMGMLPPQSQANGKSAPLGKNVSQLELCDPEARLGLQRILDVQLQEKRDRMMQEIEQNRMF